MSKTINIATSGMNEACAHAINKKQNKKKSYILSVEGGNHKSFNSILWKRIYDTTDQTG